jgi:hypothetical protein
MCAGIASAEERRLAMTAGFGCGWRLRYGISLSKLHIAFLAEYCTFPN